MKETLQGIMAVILAIIGVIMLYLLLIGLLIMIKNVCEKCLTKWECEQPCAKAIAWEQLDEKYTIKDYEPVGLAMFTSVEQKNRLKKVNKV